MINNYNTNISAEYNNLLSYYTTTMPPSGMGFCIRCCRTDYRSPYMLFDCHTLL